MLTTFFFGCPPDRILLKVFTASDYTYNHLYLRAHKAIDLRTLKHLQYDVVGIDYESWMRQPECERMPFLRREIGIIESTPTNEDKPKFFLAKNRDWN